MSSPPLLDRGMSHGISLTTASPQQETSPSLMLPKDESRWLHHVRTHELLPVNIPPLPVQIPSTPTRSATPTKQRAPSPNPSISAITSIHHTRQGVTTPYLLRISHITGLRIPPHLRSTPTSSLATRISLSLFDTYTHTFFGRTWTSSLQPLQQHTDGTIYTGCHIAYRTPIHDERCIGVVECVLLVMSGDVITAQHGIGWSTLHLFGHISSRLRDADTVSDITWSPHTSNIQSERDLHLMHHHLLAGTPRALMFTGSDHEWQKKVARAGDSRVWYEVMTWKSLKRIFHLFRDNEFLSERDFIGGFPGYNNPITTDPLYGRLPHIPRLLNDIVIPATSITMVRPCIILPIGFDRKLLESLTNVRQQQWANNYAEVGTIISRSLRIGIHNGRTFLKPPQSLMLVDAPQHDTTTRLIFDGEFTLSDLVCSVEHDPAMALVVELEYALKWAQQQSHITTTATICVGFTIRMMHSQDVTMDGAPHTYCLQRGPFRTLGNQRTYGFRDPYEEQSRATDQTHIWLEVALLTPDHPPLHHTSGLRGSAPIPEETPQLFINIPTTPSRESTIPIPHERWNEPIPTPLPPPSPVNTHLLRPSKESRLSTPTDVGVGDDEYDHPYQQDRIIEARVPLSSPPSSSSSTPSLSIGIQTMSESEQLPIYHTGHMRSNDTSLSMTSMMNKGADLEKEWKDPLTTTQFSIGFRQFSQTRATFKQIPVTSLVLVMKFFNQVVWISKRIPLEMATDGPDTDMGETHDSLLHATNDYIHSHPFVCEWSCSIPSQHHTTWITYMHTHAVCIDVFDGDGCFLLGQTYLSLEKCMRQGRPSIDKFIQIPIFEAPLSQLGGQFDAQTARPNITHLSSEHGKLSLQVTHSGIAPSLDDDLSATTFIPTTTTLRQSLGNTLSSTRMGSIQRPSLSKTWGNTKRLSMTSTITSISRESPEPGQNIALNSTTNRGSKIRAKKLIEEQPGLKATLSGTQALSGFDQSIRLSHTFSDVQSSKLDDLRSTISSKAHSTRKSISKHDLIRSDPSEIASREANLAKIREFRESMAINHITQHLRTVTTQTRTIYPSLGECIFFEVAFTNPFPKRSRFMISIDDICFPKKGKENKEENEKMGPPELHLISDQKEWLYHKHHHGLTTSSELRMERMNENQSKPSHFNRNTEEIYEYDYDWEIVVEPHDTVYIPFKFQSYRCYDNELIHGIYPYIPDAPITPSYQNISHRIISIDISSSKDHAVVAVMKLDVRPMGYVVDHTMRFHQWADDMLHGLIPLPTAPVSTLVSTQHPLFPCSTSLSTSTTISTLHTLLPSQFRIHHVHCSHQGITFHFTDHSQHEPPHHIAFRMNVSSFPTITRFIMCLYTDPYATQLYSRIQCDVHAHLRAQLNCVVGQRTVGRMYLPQTKHVRRVRCYTSSPHELQFDNTQEFLLEPDRANQLDYTYRTSHAGKSSCLVHLIDTTTHELIESWLLGVNASFPKVHNTFNVKLKLGIGARKQFSYENPYKMTRTYHIDTSAPHLLKIREQQLTIGALSQTTIHVIIEPCTIPGNETVFVFINDRKGRTEECLQFNLHYS